MSAAKVENMKDDRVPGCLFWSTEDVANWIEGIGYPYYKECFLSNLINGRKLIAVTASSLPDIGITDFQHILHITQSIRGLLNIEDPDWSRSISLPPRNELGMFLEKRSVRGERSDALTYTAFLRDFDAIKWQPPLSNHCQILPHD